jgi:hypothetical protein
VRRHDHQSSGRRQRPDQADQPGLVDRVLPQRWLVQQQAVTRPAHEHRRQRDPLLLALAQQQGGHLLVAAQPQRIQEPGVPGHVRVGQPVENLVADGTVKELQVGVLKDHSQVRSLAICGHRASVLLQPRQRAQQHRLTHAVATHDRQHTSPQRREAQIPQDVAPAKCDPQL